MARQVASAMVFVCNTVFMEIIWESLFYLLSAVYPEVLSIY